jgi:hypothetical protein
MTITCRCKYEKCGVVFEHHGAAGQMTCCPSCRDTQDAKPIAVTSYAIFLEVARSKGWTLAALRCDVPPTDELLAVMDQIGLAKYEAFVRRVEREGGR